MYLLNTGDNVSAADGIGKSVSEAGESEVKAFDGFGRVDARAGLHVQ
jgi:hypothetical protein